MKKGLPLFVGVDTVKFDLGVSRAKAYEVIKQLNKEMKEQNPRAIVVSGKVNQIWCSLIRKAEIIRKEKAPRQRGRTCYY